MLALLQAGGQSQTGEGALGLLGLAPDGKIWATPMEDQSLGLQLPLILEEDGVGGVLEFFGGWRGKQPPFHLAAGSWDRGQEGPICRLPVLPASLSRLGWRGGWGGQLSGPGLLRPRWEQGPL